MKEEKDECQDFKKAFSELFINFRILKPSAMFYGLVKEV